MYQKRYVQKVVCPKMVRYHTRCVQGNYLIWKWMGYTIINSECPNLVLPKMVCTKNGTSESGLPKNGQMPYLVCSRYLPNSEMDRLYNNKFSMSKSPKMVCTKSSTSENGITKNRMYQKRHVRKWYHQRRLGTKPVMVKAHVYRFGQYKSRYQFWYFLLRSVLTLFTHTMSVQVLAWLFIN